MPSHRSSAKRSAGRSKPSSRSRAKRWVATVKTDSTHPQKGLFRKDATTIARSLASKRVSPKGLSSGLRMLVYYINRGGKGLSPSRRRELEEAKELLSARIAKAKGKKDKEAA